MTRNGGRLLCLSMGSQRYRMSAIDRRSHLVDMKLSYLPLFFAYKAVVFTDSYWDTMTDDTLLLKTLGSRMLDEIYFFASTIAGGGGAAAGPVETARRCHGADPVRLTGFISTYIEFLKKCKAYNARYATACLQPFCLSTLFQHG
jgi:hypothetical protein